MRYVGQEYTVNVAIGPEISLDTIDTTSTRRTASATDTPRRARRSSSSTSGSPRWAGSAPGDAPFQAPEDGQDPLLGRRSVVFSGDEHETVCSSTT